MITPIVSSAMYSTNRRAVLEAIPLKLRKLWKDWDLRVTILLSLIIQILLSILGNHRKHSRSQWFRALVWAAYTAADSVAIFALGIISNNISDMREESEHLNSRMELSAFWAQFLVLHLGGPDSITAYALEDNELWMRQLVGLATQTCGAVYVILLAWTSEGSRLSILSILMFIAGFIKYGERIYVLRAASFEVHRNSVLSQRYPDFSGGGVMIKGQGGLTARDFQEYQIKSSEGYIVGVEFCYDPDPSINLSGSSNKSIFVEEKEKLLIASGFLGATKRVFVDASLSSIHRDRSRALFRCLPSEDAFQINEIQLGMIFDLHYNKSMLLHSRMGLLLRLVTIFLVSSSLVFFAAFLDHKDKYPKVDVSITFLLLVVAFLLEVYAVLVLIFSDKSALWLIKHNKTSTLQTLNSFRLLKSPRWSNSMSQYVLLGSKRALKHNGSLLAWITKSTHMEWNTKITKDLKEILFKYFKEKAEELAITGNPLTTLPTNITANQEEGQQEQDIRINWEDFEHKIIIWSIVTELFYCLDREHVRWSFLPYCKAIKRISRYMLYLLVRHPSFISAETGLMVISFEEISHDVNVIIRSSETKAEFWKTFLKTVIYDNQKIQNLADHVDRLKKPSSIASLLKKTAMLVTELQETADQQEKWERIGNVWLELLECAAAKSKGIEHTKHLRSGGAFLTHVWLLMVNLGLTHHFVSSGGRGVDKFIAK